MKSLICIAASVLLFGCAPAPKNTKPETIGKYVYMDSRGILHTENPCILGGKVTDENGETYYSGIKRIDTSNIYLEDLQSLCPWCIDDKIYEKLFEMANKELDW